ncbi:Cell division control protein/predicted DNA repair exonuclease [Forsythia ovata]|uniref:Cell division control protein/predicted DNA repair exonuclease n=1 Tax=Forsythia ovata TaxID=205694 RepID=A0ABD1PEV0_9LAMI
MRTSTSTWHGGAVGLSRLSSPAAAHCYYNYHPRLCHQLSFPCHHGKKWRSVHRSVHTSVSIVKNRRGRARANSNAEATSSWDEKPYEVLPSGKIAYLDEQDVVAFLDPPKELIPLDPSSYNPAAYIWKKIEDIPEERRHRLLTLLKPRLISRAWEIAGTRYDNAKLANKSASSLLSNGNGTNSLEMWNCRTSGGPFPISWIKFFQKAIFRHKDGNTYGRLIGGSLMAGIFSSFSPLYFTVREVNEVLSTEQPCDLSYEFGDGLLDLSEYPQGFPKPAKHPWPFNDQVVIYVRHMGPGVLVGQAWQEGEAVQQVPKKLCVWALSLLYGEWFAFLVPSLWTCSWPHLHRQSSLINGVDYSSNYMKVAVITDPQLMDRTSLRLPPKSLVLEIAQFYTDLYMRRAFLASILPFNPDIVLFLGDYFDGGPILSDEEWLESLGRFRHIFSLNMLQQSANVKVYFLDGNHDIGYAAFNSRMPEVIRRYEKEFGARNYRFTLGKVNFIAIDAQTLDGNQQSDLTSATWNFVRNVSMDVDSTPRVLLTHIPLYRPDSTSCSAHRSSPIINQRISRSAHDQEILYQNYVTEKSTDELLDFIRPALVLSGHDHDQCTVTHVAKYGAVTEHTVGTVSWQQGNLYPSFMLLSASNFTLPNGSTPEDAISTRLCFLPVQTFIYIWYLSLFAMTLIILLWPANEVFIFRKFGDLMGYIRSLINFSSFSNGMKEKNEDENCEYETIWDAEGNMHLIRKASQAPKTYSDGRILIERGNAVMRSKARKQIMQELDPSTPSEVNIHIGIDGLVKLPGRTTKSTARIVIWRLLRAFQALTIIAAINVPLYVLLLFKDWIDK